MLDSIFLRILDMTATGSLVILGVLLGRLLLKRAPKVFAYALWAVVLLRLLCPVSIEAPVSLLPQRAPVSQSYDLGDVPVSLVGAGVAAYRVVGDALNGGLGIQHVPTTRQDAWGNTEYVSTDWWNVVLLAGQYLWLAGVAVMLLYSALSWLRLRRKLRVVLPAGENVFLADDIGAPFVIGLFRPRIYLPGALTEKEREYILLHEHQHIRRGDPWIKMLAFLALSLHWFNPLVWLAFVLSSRDMEMSCDEAVLGKLGPEIRADYAASLLTLATGRRIIAGAPLAFGEGDPKGRIRNLAKWKKPALWILVVAAVVCLILGVCLLTDPVNREHTSETLPQAPTGEQMEVVTEGDRLAPGVYIPTGYLYTNPLSSYYPGNLSQDFRYTVTEDSFITEGILIVDGSDSVEVDWRWQTLKEAGKKIAFFKNTPYYKLLTGENCRIQPLEVGRFLIANGEKLYLLQGGVGKEALWYIYTLEPAQPEMANKLTLAKVLELSQKGSAMTWKDLEGYAYEDVGSGLYICEYPIDAAFTLRVTDGQRSGSPMQVLLVYNLTGASLEIRSGDVASFIRERSQRTMEVMIGAAIAEDYSHRLQGGLVPGYSYRLLAEESAIDTSFTGEERVTEERAYLLVMQKTYNIFGEVPVEVGGSYGAAVITFSVDEAGQYSLKEFWRPRDGGYYARDIRDQFPGEAAEAALNDHLYTQELDRACYGMACTYVSPGNTLRDRIETLFLEVASAPAQYSMPAPYIEAHPEQWQELISYGENTLRYCFSEFTPSGQKGLLELLMALACEQILENLGEQGFPPVEGHGTGSQWFNHYKEYAHFLLEEKGSQEVEKHHPGAWLWLQMQPPSVAFHNLSDGGKIGL